MAAKKPKGPQPFDEFVNLGQEYVDERLEARIQMQERGKALDELYERINLTIGKILKAKPLATDTAVDPATRDDRELTRTTTMWELDGEEIAKVTKIHLGKEPTHLIRLTLYDEDRDSTSHNASIQYPDADAQVRSFLEELVEKAGDMLMSAYKPTPKPAAKRKPRTVKKPVAKKPVAKR